MMEAVQGLNRDTVARNNGITTDNASMNRFCKLILEHKIEDQEAYRNRLEYVSSYDGLSTELRGAVETLKVEYDKANSKTDEKGMSY